MRRRLRSESGFGLAELVIAMAMLSVALLALVAALSSGIVTLQRSGTAATAGTLADKQMERYRALKYTSIQLDTASVTTANSDSVYTSGPGNAWNASQVTGTCTSPVPVECQPKQTVTGPDNHQYRIDTYIVYDTPADPDGAGPLTAGRQLKLITVVVRDPQRLTGVPLAKLQSRFDQATGR
jgi:type II secretory pathway pseudopilin PulG